MNTTDNDIEKLIWLVDGHRAGLERLRAELQQLKEVLEAQGLRTGPGRTPARPWGSRPAFGRRSDVSS